MSPAPRSLPQVREPPGCESCIADCCRAFSLAIEGHDAYRIAQRLSLPLRGFCELRWSEQADDAHRIVLEPEPARFHRLLLIRLADADGPHPLRCTFLLDVDDRARCGIYAERPTMCRVYPSFIREGRLGTSGGKYCPTGVWRLETMDQPLLHCLHTFRERQRAIFRGVIDGWNRRVIAAGRAMTADHFFDFVLDAYDELTAHHAGWFVEPTPDEPEPFAHADMRASTHAALRRLQGPQA